ncbi:hypothetical protein GGI35DRAFT_463597, partial [Trichoderma velutinum]
MASAKQNSPSADDWSQQTIGTQIETGSKTVTSQSFTFTQDNCSPYQFKEDFDLLTPEALNKGWDWLDPGQALQTPLLKPTWREQQIWMNNTQLGFELSSTLDVQNQPAFAWWQTPVDSNQLNFELPNPVQNQVLAAPMIPTTVVEDLHGLQSSSTQEHDSSPTSPKEDPCDVQSSSAQDPSPVISSIPTTVMKDIHGLQPSLTQQNPTPTSSKKGSCDVQSSSAQDQDSVDLIIPATVVKDIHGLQSSSTQEHDSSPTSPKEDPCDVQSSSAQDPSPVISSIPTTVMKDIHGLQPSLTQQNPTSTSPGGDPCGVQSSSAQDQNPASQISPMTSATQTPTPSGRIGEVHANDHTKTPPGNARKRKRSRGPQILNLQADNFPKKPRLENMD